MPVGQYSNYVPVQAKWIVQFISNYKKSNFPIPFLMESSLELLSSLNGSKFISYESYEAKIFLNDKTYVIAWQAHIF